MMTTPDANDRQETLERIKNWYEQTGNPLYVWEAIARCLHADEEPRFPDWCLDYLRDAAKNIYQLSCGVDFRGPHEASSQKIGPDDAFKLVSNALSISSQGSKNAFSALLDDREDMKLGVELRYSQLVTGFCESERNISKERVRRKAKRGTRLLGVKDKTSTGSSDVGP